HTRSKRDWSSDVCSSDLSHTNLGIGWQKTNQGRAHSHSDKRGDEHRTTTKAVTPVPSQKCSQWTEEEANTNRRQRQHQTKLRAKWLKHQCGKHHARRLSVDKEVVVLDCGSGNRRKSYATVLRLRISGHEILQLLACV